MNLVAVSNTRMYFEYGAFDWLKYDDRRIVHSSHVVSMTDTALTKLGEGWHELQDGLSPPGPLGPLLIAPATVPFHTCGGGGRFSIARLQIHPDNLDLHMLSHERDARLLGKCLNMVCPDIIHGMRRLIREARAPSFASDVVLDAVGTMILIDITRYLQYARSQTRTSRGLSQREIQKICDYIDGHLTMRISVRELAILLGISERHFIRLFRAETGETVRRFIERRRFERAKALLDEDDRPLKQIAHLLGFSSRVSFTLAFQRMAGQSPRDYRRQRFHNYHDG